MHLFSYISALKIDEKHVHRKKPNISHQLKSKLQQICLKFAVINLRDDCMCYVSPQSHRDDDSFPRAFQTRNRFQRNILLRIDVHRNRNTTSLAEWSYLTVKYI